MDYLEQISSLDENDENRNNRKFDQLPDFHLRSPLKPMEYLYKELNSLSKRHRDSIAALSEYRRTLVEGDPVMLRYVFLDHPFHESTRIAEDCLSDVIIRIKKDSKLNFPLPTDMMLSSVQQLGDEFPTEMWDRMRFSSNLVSTMNAISSRRPPPKAFMRLRDNLYKTATKTGTIYITASMLGIEEVTVDGESKPYLICFDGDWLRMVSDLYAERFLVYIGSTLGHRINGDHYPDAETIFEIVQWGDKVLEREGNNGFKLLKAYEALCNGHLQSMHPSQVIDCELFLNNTVNDLIMENTRFAGYVDTLLTLLSRIDSPHHISQLYGLHRIWGHPIVDNRKGMEKVRMIGLKEITRSDVVSREAGRSFKIMFCREYRKKNGTYPKVVPCNNDVYSMIEKNDGRAVEHAYYRESDWDEIQFDKCFDIPETFNLSMVVADKSISLTRSELTRNIIQRRSVMNQEKRRGVLRWINDQSIKPREFLEDVNKGDFPEDHMIIGLTPKERELNPTPRMFALMSHLMRIYVVLTEQMLSDEILKMFPQITMTDSLLDLTKKLYTTVRPQAEAGKMRRKNKTWASKTVCISLDFEKWNGHMRYESTYWVFLCLGQLFGLPELYNQTYEIFSRSIIYLADGTYVPSVKGGNLVVDEPYVFEGHKGGMEGLRQKGWTIFTVCCLNMVCERYNCTYKIMGMGDNQVLQITLFTYKVDSRGAATEQGCTEMRNTLRALFEALIYTFRQIGLPLKPLETWMSEDLYLYGKYPLLRGVPLSMDLKKIMRMFHNSNDDIMTVENGMGTVYGNAASAVQLTSCSLVPYIIGMYMASYCSSCFLEYHPLLGTSLILELQSDATWGLYMPGERPHLTRIGGRNFSIQCLRLLMQTVPRTLGGYNSLNIFEIIMRGFPDNLSRDLTYVYQITSGDEKDAVDEALINWVHPIYMPSKNFQLLLEDVSSVNLLSPRSPSSGIRQAVEKYIGAGRAVKNREFKDLIKTKNRDQIEFLAEKLCGGSDLHIRLLHDIYSSTIVGYVEGILSKVTKASTIQRIAVLSNKKDIMQVVMDDEVNFFRFFVWRSSVRSDTSITVCPTDMAKRLRSESWGKRLRGVTVPFPMAYLEPTKCGDIGHCLCSDGYISIHFPDKQETNHAWNRSLGGNAPYLGSITKEKVVTGAGSKVYSSEPLVRRPLNLLRAINWFIPSSSNTASTIRALTHAVTDLNPRLYEGQSEGTAGAEAHRYRDMSLKHGALSASNYLYATRMHISTDNFTRYSKGGDNYDVHFQACLCGLTEWCNMMLLDKLSSKDWIPKVIHFKQNCYDCVHKVDESFVDLDDPHLPHYIPSRKNNPYLYVSQSALIETHKMRPLLSRKLRIMPAEEYNSLTSKGKMRWLTDTVADMIYLDIAGNKGEDNAFSMCLTEVKAYERTMFLKMNPRKVFEAVIDRIKIQVEINVTTMKEGQRANDAYKRDRAIAMIHSCPSSSFLGLAMFYSWEETVRKMRFAPYCVMPNSFPMTMESMCNAARMTLTVLIDRDYKSLSRLVYCIPHDFHNNLKLHKLVSFSAVRQWSRCGDCLKFVGNMEIGQFGLDVTDMSCDSGHDIASLLKLRCRVSYVTLERLRKDASEESSSGADEQRVSNRRVTKVPHMSKTDITMLIDFARVMQKEVAWTEDIPYPSGLLCFRGDNINITRSGLHKVVSYPTSTAYRYVELLSKYSWMITGHTMVVGDGLGTTSELVLSYCKSDKVTVSTLADTGLAAPQTYPHAIQPLIRSYPDLIDTKTMLNKHNDILSPDYVDEWESIFRQCQSLVSDIEIIGPELRDERTVAIRKLLEITSWKGFIIKDYIYDMREFTERCSIIVPKVKGLLHLVTSKMRASSAPEVWWIGGGTSPEYKNRRCYDPRSMKQDWNECVKNMMFNRDYKDQTILEDLSRRVVTPDALSSAYGVALNWSILPIIGKTLPSGGTYTSVYYKMFVAKRPIIVNIESDNSVKRMYRSDYYKIRTVLFGLAAAMIADINVREQFVNDASKWILDWEPNSRKTTWVPYLYYSNVASDLPNMDISDVLPYLSLYMASQHLIFRTLKRSIRFRCIQAKRQVVTFPISRPAMDSFNLRGVRDLSE
ncbi:TPA_asm: L [Chrysanthemum alphacytorhabdovirus 1]|nr:TPA_asm: L [Chrysanthemum alphacytorhabdovirus 1]